MGVTVVGSIAFDRVKSPFGERERMLGGAATYFALAASFFDTVTRRRAGGRRLRRGRDRRAAHPRHDVTDIERVVPAGETFFWHGEYGWDLNQCQTLATELGVFAEFEPQALAGRRAPATSSSWPTSSRRCSSSVREQLHVGPLRRARLDELLDRRAPATS